MERMQAAGDVITREIDLSPGQTLTVDLPFAR
jgi:hypothetical protein